ncbi:MAG TPA: hypothetical protein VMZ71_02275 [Gemmataceae bacterium]|nr:hypothetical protein [Gemmataceae bacterium]
MAGDLDHPLLPVTTAWLALIRLGLEAKRKRFGLDAEDGMKFFAGPYDFLYGDEAKRSDRHFKQAGGDDDDEIPPPTFKMTCNKVAELVQIFGPVLYHRNPVRQVNPREVPLPDADLAAAFGGNPAASLALQQMYQQGVTAQAADKTRAKLLSHYLNYTPDALDLKTESRKAIDEGLIKGMGLLSTEVYVDALGNKMVGSFHKTVDDLVIDPDMPSRADAKWVAIRQCVPVWDAERKFGLPKGSLKGNQTSGAQNAATDVHPDGDYMRKCGRTNDLLVYWEVYSKTGLGGRLQGVADWIREPLEAYGDFCYLAVADGVGHPLNVPAGVWSLPAEQGRQEVYRRVQWPTPFWADGGWPFEELAFHDIPEDPWPMSHLAPGMGELKFLNWAFSYIASKIRVTSRDFLAILEEATDSTRQTITHGADLEIIKLKGSHGKTINEVVQFLQHPNFNGDIWRVIEAIAEQFDRRVGLTELMYGQSAKQLRSAEEASIKSAQMSVRPDEMANKVEDWMGRVARKEAFAARWHLKAQDVAPVMGPAGTQMWALFITPSDPAVLLHSLEYRIEAGSVRKPNRDRDTANWQTLMTTVGPFYQSLVSAGLVGPFNTLMEGWLKSMDAKPDGLLIPAPQMPIQPAQPQQGQQPQGAA